MTGKELKAAVAELKDESQVLLDIPDVDDYVVIIAWSTDKDGDLILTTEEVDLEDEDD